MAAEKGGDERSVEAAERSPANAEMKPLTLAEQAKKAIGEAAEDARLRILGPPGRARTAGPPAPAEEAALPEGIDEDTAEAFRHLVDGVEEEIRRLEEQTWRLRAEIDQAAAKLHDELDQAAEALVVRAAEDAQREEVHAQQIGLLTEAITQAVEAGRRQVEELTQAAAAADAIDARFAAIDLGMAGVETRLSAIDAEITRVAGALEQVQEPQAREEARPGSLPDIGRSLLEALELVAEQLSAFNQRIEQLPDRIAERLDTGGGDKTAEVLTRLTDEVGRLRRRLPVRRKLAESTAKSRNETEEPTAEDEPGT